MAGSLSTAVATGSPVAFVRTRVTSSARCSVPSSANFSSPTVRNRSIMLGGFHTSLDSQWQTMVSRECDTSSRVIVKAVDSGETSVAESPPVELATGKIPNEMDLKLSENPLYQGGSILAQNSSSPLPVSQKIASGDPLSFTPGKSDLLVVGPGVLGSLVAQGWFKVNEGECNVVGQTNTSNRHEQLRSIGIIPITKDAHKGEKFPYVIFCAPPSGSEDYVAEVRAAAERWNGEGSLLFTSSSALYAVSDNGICDEETASIVPKGAGPRTDRLHAAEEEVLKVGGNVVRLAGLYTLERGAHSYYLSQGTITQRPDHLINLIHYEDAASLCVAIMRGEHRGRIFLGCDNHPLSRQELMDAANECGKYEKKFEGFTSTSGPLGKRMNNDPTRRATGWKPKYESFPSFLGVPIAHKI